MLLAYVSEPCLYVARLLRYPRGGCPKHAKACIAIWVMMAVVLTLQVTSPMDLATLLARVDDRHYPTLQAFLAAVALIPAAEKQYWGDDPEGIREAGFLSC